MAARMPEAVATLPADQQQAFAQSGFSENSLTPTAVSHLPGPIQDVIISSYNDALLPVFTLLIPLVITALILVFFIKHEKLRETSMEMELEKQRESDPAAIASDSVRTVLTVDDMNSQPATR